jgi:dihydrofolate reductase
VKIEIVVAYTENRVIGRNNDLPWRGQLPADMRHFRELTMGHPIVMGRKTFESIGKPLPGRTNIVLTKQATCTIQGCLVARSIEEALEIARRSDAASVGLSCQFIGGEQVYAESLPGAETVYTTEIHHTFEGDAFFPALEEGLWEVTSDEYHGRDEKNLYPFSFRTYTRK